MKFSSEPPTAALFLWGNRDVEIEIFERDQKFRSGANFFDRWALWVRNRTEPGPPCN